jgi:formylglycine-generating enzyme required for sulfatase activity
LHLTFQEYLAAVAIAHLGQSDIQPVVTKLLKHAAQENWREVILLTIAYIGLIQHRDEAASAVLLSLMEQAGEQSEQATLLAGDALRNAWPGGVSVACYTAVIHALQTMMENADQTAAVRRARAGQLLAQLGDPREFVTAVDEMLLCYIPSGTFWMGSGTEEHLNDILSYDYWMSRFPITNAQFAQFVAAGGYDTAAFWTEAEAVDRWQNGVAQDWLSRGWRKRPYDYGLPYNLSNHPVVGITWYEALAFTRWLNQHWQENGWLPGNWTILLPSEAEWEKAARGGLEVPTKPLVEPVSKVQQAEIGRYPQQANPFPKRLNPWAGEAEANLANYRATGIEATNAVGCFANGTTLYGCEEMCGNVWEWTRSQYHAYPYSPHDGRETEIIKLYHQMVIRGGAYWVDDLTISSSARARRSPNDRNSNYSFRVVVMPHV